MPYDYQTRINVLSKSTDLSLVRFSYEILRKPPTLCKRNTGTSRKCRPKTDREPLAQTQTLPVSTKNPLCEGVDSITQLLSCVPRLKKLHLIMLWWCSVCERILSVQETASLLNIFLAVCEGVHRISQHLI